MPMPIGSAVEQRWYRAVLVQSGGSADKSKQSSGSSKQCWSGQCHSRIVLVQDRASRLVLVQSSADSEQAWAYHTGAE